MVEEKKEFEQEKASEIVEKEEVIVGKVEKSATTHESVEVRLEGLTKIFVDKTKKETRAFFILSGLGEFLSTICLYLFLSILSPYL